MKLDQTAPEPAIISETRKQAPAPDAWRAVLIPAALGLTSGLATTIAAGLLALVFGWKVSVVMALTAGTILVGLCVGLRQFRDLTLTVEESTEYGQPAPVVEQQTMLEFQEESGSIHRYALNVPPELVLEWCRAAVARQSLSYATWAEQFGGQPKYAKFRARLVKHGLALEQENGLGLTTMGWRVFGTAVEKGDEALPHIAKWPMLQGPDNDDPPTV